MSYKLLDIGDPQWVAAVMGLGPARRDLHQDQRLLAPYVAAYKYKAFLAFTDTEDGYIVEPVLQTPEGDLRHAYNFGGPMASTDFVNATEHVDSLNKWAIENNSLKKYCTLVPHLSEHQIKLLGTANIVPELRKQSVIIDFQNQKIRGTARRAANKALEEGLVVKDYQQDGLSSFIDLYEETMDRVGAKDHWRFTPKWFELFFRFAKPCLLMAKMGSKIQAGSLIAFSQQYQVAYYHFAASTGDHHPGAGHMILMAACEFVKSMGIRYLYLGGGVTDEENDSLLSFKRGFSKDLLPVYTYSRSYLN